MLIEPNDRPLQLAMMLEYTRVMELQELVHTINMLRFQEDGTSIDADMTVRLVELTDMLVDSARKQIQRHELMDEGIPDDTDECSRLYSSEYGHDFQDVYDNGEMICTFCGAKD